MRVIAAPQLLHGGKMNIQASLETILASLLAFLPQLFVAIMIFILSLILSGMLSKWIGRIFEHKPYADKTVVALLTKVTHAMVIIFGGLLALQQVNFNVTGFLTGLGIIGLTVGFALQDIGRNFVAGIIMLIYRPFSIGDEVQVAEYSGEVLDITLRDTVIKTWDGEKVILPNNNVFNAAIVNYSDLVPRRRTINILLSPDEEIGRIAQVFKVAVENVPGVLSSPAVAVQLDSISESGLSLLIRFWVDQNKVSMVQTHSDAIQAVQQAAKESNIRISSMVNRVYIENASQ